MALHFKYKTVKRPDGNKVKTPSIPITFVGKQSFDTVALLDSGADISAMPKSLAEILGLDISGKRTPAFGIGGKVQATDTKAKVIVERGHEKYTLTIPVKVILGTYDFPVLLGRSGFFDKFVVSFNQSEERISLKRVSGKVY